MQSPFCIGSINGIIVVRIRKTEIQTGQILWVSAPSDGKHVGVPMSGVVGQAWNIKVPTAVERRGIADGAGIIAAGEDPGAGVYTAAGGKRLKTGVVSRLVVKGLNIEREKIRVIVRAEQVGGAGAYDAVVGTGEVRIIVTVSARDRAAKIQAGLAAVQLRGGSRGKSQYGESENGDFSTHRLRDSARFFPKTAR